MGSWEHTQDPEVPDHDDDTHNLHRNDDNNNVARDDVYTWKSQSYKHEMTVQGATRKNS